MASDDSEQPASAPGLVRSPCDLRSLPTGTPVEVGGRIVLVGEDSFTLADALHRVEVAKSAEAQSAEEDASGEIRVGRFAIVVGTWTGERVADAVVSAVRAGQEPRAQSEHASLAWSGRARGLEARFRATSVIRQLFAEWGFLEVDTPTVVPCPGLDPHVHSLGCVSGATPEEATRVGLGGSRVGSAGAEEATRVGLSAAGPVVGFLRTSPEFHMKRLLAGGLPRIYQIARCFRAEELGPLHEPEFTLLEWYRAFDEGEAVLGDTEQIVAAVVQSLAGRSQVLVDGVDVDFEPPFERLTIREAFRKFAGENDAVTLAETDEDRYFELLVDRVEPGLAQLGRPVFLINYPATQAALARRHPDDSTVAQRFELYAGPRELCNGYVELVDPSEQRSRFEAELERRRGAGEPTYPIDENFLRAMEEGLPPCTGNALGLERLVAVALGLDSIQLSVSFPAFS